MNAHYVDVLLQDGCGPGVLADALSYLDFLLMPFGFRNLYLVSFTVLSVSDLEADEGQV